MKPKVDKNLCIGCGACVSICPKVFKLNKDNKSEVLKADYEANKDCIKQAIDNCPVCAISE